MIRYASFGALMWLLIAPMAPAHQKQTGTTAANRIVLGRFAAGAAVAFVRAVSGDWGIEISGAAVPRLTQQKPAQIEVFRDEENVLQLAAGYWLYTKTAGNPGGWSAPKPPAITPRAGSGSGMCPCRWMPRIPSWPGRRKVQRSPRADGAVDQFDA
jgi:hypothetical protein